MNAREKRLWLAVACMALIVGVTVSVGMAAAQATQTVNVKVGTGTVMHRSGTTLILNVTEGGGEQGLGFRKINVKSTDDIVFHDRMGNEIQVEDLKEGDVITAYRHEQRAAPVKITISEVEEIKKAEPPAPRSAPRPAPAPAPAPAARPTQLPSTASALPLILLLAVLSLGVALTLRLARRRV